MRVSLSVVAIDEFRQAGEKIPLASSLSHGFKFKQQETESAVVIGWHFARGEA
ncbi:hypothetical protein [Bradyrhizobium sp. ORS 86]|uniref:hypothetical protein n=1 Tax=Bradyrhizobium sp. ORS 86 TaxID=1685970 RepID=UPI00388FAE93